MWFKPILWGTLLGVCTASAQAQEWSMRCAKSLVKEGDATSELLAKCGKPAHKEKLEHHFEEEVVDPKTGKTRLYQRTRRVERWTYDFGPNEFTRDILVAKGQILSITLGERGTAKPAGSMP
jgi:hypothetical protein